MVVSANKGKTIGSNRSIGKLSDTIPAAAQKLINSYRGIVKGYSNNHIIFTDNTELVWDDGIKNKSFKDILNKPDLKDMFSQHYQTGQAKTIPAVNFDPGRIRNEPFFLKVYGKSEREVKNNLTEITWCPKLVNQKIMVTKVNGIDKKFIEISNELDQHPELKKYLTDIGGTFDWRYIAGTKRQSMHSFGMTMDINITYTNYWEWECKCTDESIPVKYVNKIPQVIVDIFEKHGFIWGGKWYHFDTMHFEYRPELLP